MKKNKILYKLKRIMIVILCSITLFFSMPVKSKANIWEDLVDVVLKLPDAVMRIANDMVSGRPVTKFKIRLNLKGWDGDTIGSIYNFEITPYDIFTSGLEEEDKDYNGNSLGTHIKIPILDINFFKDSNQGTKGDSADILRPVVSNVYKSLRNLVLVLMMVVLLYIGVRIIVATAVTDQVKYKQWLVDWVVGICLVVLMQYIMSFLMNVNEIVLKMLGDNKAAYYYISLSKLGSGSGESSWGDIKAKATPGDSDYEPEYEYFFNKHLDIANSEADIDTINDQGNFAPTDASGNPLGSSDPFMGYFKVDSRTDWGKNSNGVVFTNARIFRFSDVGTNTLATWGTVALGNIICPGIRRCNRIFCC